MEDLIIYGLGALLGGIFGGLVISAIIKYYKKALKWFEDASHHIRKYRLAIGVLVREGSKVFKRFFVQFITGEEEIFEENGDEGVELEPGELPEEIESELKNQGFVAIWSDRN